MTGYAIGATQSFQTAFDGTHLWLASIAGIWQTTPAAPGTGAYATVTLPGNGDTNTILYDAPSKTLWATGLGSTTPFTYTLTLPAANPMRLLL